MHLKASPVEGVRRPGAHVFVSYAREDAEIAARLQEQLLRAGAASVWLDRKSIEGGDDWKSEINEGLLKTEVLVAVLTKHSVDEARRWIRHEHLEAIRLLRPIVPLLFDDCELPPHLGDVQYVDFRAGWETGVLGLLNALGKVTLRRGEGDLKFTEHAPPLGRRFVGREQDLRRLFRLIEGEHARVETGRPVVAIQGMGGTGKTMVAEELVRRLSVRYPGGVTVEQRGQSPESAAAVLQRWAKVILGDYPNPQWSVVDVRSELQRKYGTLLLLVDDVQERDLGDVAQLLKALPSDATRIVTTRSLGVEALGAVVYRLPDFGEDDAFQLLRDRLRGKGEDPGDDVLRKLVATVGGHALSMDLIAGRCRHTRDLPEHVEKLARRLARGDVGRIALDVLGKRGSKDYSVALSLEESYTGLKEHDAAEGTEWARRFRALGVVPDSASLDRPLAAALWNDEDPGDDAVVDALDGLFGRAMLNRDETSGLHVLHPMLDAYADGLLRADPSEAGSVWDRYVGHVAARARAGFQAPPQEWAAMEPLVPHVLGIAGDLTIRSSGLGDVDALSRPICETPVPAGFVREKERALDFAESVQRYVNRRPETGERGRRCLEIGLAASRGLGRPRETVSFLRALGRWHDQRDPHLAERYYDAALELALQSGDRAEWATVLTYKGELVRKLSRPELALELHAQALAVHEELGNRKMEALSLRSMGETHWRQNRHDTALQHHERALRIYVSLGDRSGEGDLLNKIGSVRFNQGRHEEAIPLFKQALEIHREVGDRSMEAEDLNDMGISYRYLGDLENALPRLVDAFITHRAIGSRRLQGISMCNLASVYLLQGLVSAAYELAEDAQGIAHEVEDLITEGWALSYQGLALQAQGRRDLALGPLTEALEKSRQARDRRGEAGHLGNLGKLLHGLGRTDEALGLARQAVEVMRASGLGQAFGGRRLADFETMIAEMSASTHSAS